MWSRSMPLWHVFWTLLVSLLTVVSAVPTTVPALAPTAPMLGTKSRAVNAHTISYGDKCVVQKNKDRSVLVWGRCEDYAKNNVASQWILHESQDRAYTTFQLASGQGNYSGKCWTLQSYKKHASIELETCHEKDIRQKFVIKDDHVWSVISPDLTARKLEYCVVYEDQGYLRTRRCFETDIDTHGPSSSIAITTTTQAPPQYTPSKATDCTVPASVNGEWSAWGVVTECSRTCGGGLKLRLRNCTEPTPNFGGRPCDGPGGEMTSCNTLPCEDNSTLSENGSGSGMGTSDRVRLVGFPGRSDKGRVEVYYNGEWGTVCDDIIDQSTSGSTVICRMLGFQGGVNKRTLMPGTLPILLDNVRCTGNENSIFDCSRITGHNCSHSEDFTVECY